MSLFCKRALAMFLCAMLVLGCMPGMALHAHAASGVTADGFAYKITDQGAIITGYKGSATEIVIPDTIEEYPVTGVGDCAFQESYELTAVVIPEGVTYIGDFAFFACEALSQIVVPDSVTAIGVAAFQDCSGLTDITVGAGLQTISEMAFSGCTGIQHVNTTDMAAFCAISIPYNVLSDSLHNGITLSLNGEAVSQLVIPEGVTTIVAGAFYNLTGIVSVEIPASVTKIGDYAFGSCADLTFVKFHGNVPAMGSNVFRRVTADAVYLYGDATWTEDAQKNYGGTLTWNYWGHEHDHKADVTPVTCTEQGFTVFTCECGDTYVGDYVDALGHDEVTDEAVAPSCTETGLTQGSHCRRCGEVFVAQEEVPANGHTLVVDSAVEPDCTQIGWTEGWHCSVCGYVDVAQNEIPELGHVEVIDEAVEPTCTETGLTQGSHCERCGEILVAQEVIPANGHTLVVDSAVEPDCTQIGWTEGWHCSVCGYVDVAQNEIPELGHVEVIDEAVESTCTETGLTQGSHCERCGETLVAQEEVPALGHDEVIDEAVEPTCTETGLTQGSHCERCDEILVAQEEVPALGHDEVTDEAVAPTCTETGLTEGSHCRRCGEVFVAQEEVPALGHIEVIDEAVESTCIATGLTQGSHCERCNEILIPQEEIPYGDHLYGDWVISVAPSFVAKGEQQKVCVHCSDIVSEELPVAVGVVEKWNISLTDTLQVNLHLNVSQTVASTATVKISVGQQTITYKIKDLQQTEEGLYVASVKLAAAQMTDDIVVFVLDKNLVGGYANYTVRQYVDAVLADESLSRYHKLVKEMLNYGAAAQSYFGYGSGNLADAGITGTGMTPIPDTVDQEMTVTGAAEGVSFYAATLSYRDQIAVRFYFKFHGNITDCTFAADGTVCDPGLKNGLYYVDVVGITPENLDRRIEMTVTDGNGNVLTVDYSPMNYIVRMNQKGSESLKALLTALYNYHLAAKALYEAL